MIKIWRYIAIPAAAFVVGLIIFSRILNQGVVNLIVEMPEATLPVVYMLEDGERINELHGYTEEMDASSMRDTITPIDTDGVLSVSIDSYGYKIQSIGYEIRSLDTTRLVQQSEAENLSEEDGVVTAELPVRNLLSEEEEYLLILTVTGSGQPCYFYTRIIEEDFSDIGECISFVRDFHGITMNKTRQSELTEYMETTSSADNSTFRIVTLQNNLSQMCWGNLRVVEETEPSVSVEEIGDVCNVILLDYILSSTDEQDITSYYEVEEYYRIRKGEERMYLLSFERTVEEIFHGESGELPSQELVLGIRSSDVDLMENDSGSVVCFSQAGELWSYNMSSGTLTQIFSFRSPDGFDVRSDWGEHDIRILRVGETGNVDFVVYGYMNRGAYEGRVGISVCHFDSVTTTVEEMAFLPCEESYQALQAGIGQAMYITESGQFYLIMEDRVYSVDLDAMESTLEVAAMTEGNYAGSGDGRYLAWTEGEASERTSMRLIDLETGRIDSIEAPDGYLIRPLGFLGSDCVYGLAEEDKISEDSADFPMSRVEVVDFSDPGLEILTTYESPGIYVTGVEVRDGNIYLEQSTYEGGEYTEAGEDVIYNREMQDLSSVSVTETYSEIKETEVALRLPEEIREEPERTESKWIRVEDNELRLFEQTLEKAYYVYAKGKIILATDYLVDAVSAADAGEGVVLGVDQDYVWNSAGKSSGSVEYPVAEGEEASGKTYDLTGCTLEQVLYYVGSGLPVYAVRGSRNVVITGYDGSSVRIYDPGTEEFTTETIRDASEEFEASGNAFSVTFPE